MRGNCTRHATAGVISRLTCVHSALDYALLCVYILSDGLRPAGPYGWLPGLNIRMISRPSTEADWTPIAHERGQLAEGVSPLHVLTLES
jgi:hypothetical protein